MPPLATRSRSLRLSPKLVLVTTCACLCFDHLPLLRHRAILLLPVEARTATPTGKHHSGMQQPGRFPYCSDLHSPNGLLAFVNKRIMAVIECPLLQHSLKAR